MSDVPPPLEIEAANAMYGSRPVLHGVSLRVRAGELVGLAGPNGSGKTTLLRAALGLLPLSRGVVRLSGRPVDTLQARERARQVAWMPQSEVPQDNVPVLDYVLFGRYAFLTAFEAERAVDRARAETALRDVELWDRRESGVLELSGGERQRVLLARALVQEAPLLLLDEPTAHLDVGHQLDLMDRVGRLARREGTAVVVALHDLNLAARYFPRVIVLAHGRVVDDGPPSEVLSPDLLREVWGVDAELRTDPETRHPYLIPRLPSSRRRPSLIARGTVHVIGGGGTASELLRRLDGDGWSLTAGVLPLFDTDTETAQELGVPAVVGLPFTPISQESREKLRPLLSSAESVVVAPIPVGPSNLANMEELALLPRGGPRVYLVEPVGWTGRDFTEGAATRVRERLLEHGAKVVASLAELSAELGSGSTAPASGSAGPGIVETVDR